MTVSIDSFGLTDRGRVREENEIDLRQLLCRERGLNQAFRSNRSKRRVGANARIQRGIGQNRDAIKVHQHTGMAEPRGGDGIGIPEFGRGNTGRTQHLAPRFRDVTAQQPRGKNIRSSSPNTAKTE